MYICLYNNNFLSYNYYNCLIRTQTNSCQWIDDKNFNSVALRVQTERVLYTFCNNKNSICDHRLIRLSLSTNGLNVVQGLYKINTCYCQTYHQSKVFSVTITDTDCPTMLLIKETEKLLRAGMKNQLQTFKRKTFERTELLSNYYVIKASCKLFRWQSVYSCLLPVAFSLIMSLYVGVFGLLYTNSSETFSVTSTAKVCCFSSQAVVQVPL